MIVDYHMHLRDPEERIDHTVEAVERFVETAAARGVDELGFTEHVYYFRQTFPLWTEAYQTERCVYDLDDYVEAVVEAKRRGLPVKLGLEVDYVGERQDELAELLEPYPWDYLLGSVHWIDGHAVDSAPDRGIWAEAAVEEVWRRYFAALTELASSGHVDVLAHPDLAKIFGFRPEAIDYPPLDGVALEIANGDDRLRFERNPDKTWKIAKATEKTPEGFELEPKAIEQRIVALRSLRATTVAPPGAKTGLDKPSATLTATDDKGQSVAAVFGADTKQDDRDAVFARGNADEEAYVVAKFTRDNLTGGIATFAHQDQPPGGVAGGPASGLGAIDPAALQNLPPEVRQQLLQQLVQEQQKREQAGKAAAK